MTERSLSSAIAAGDGISLVAAVDGPDAARHAEADGAEAILVPRGLESRLAEIREAVSLPILAVWDGGRSGGLAAADACVVDFDPEEVEEVEPPALELAWRVGGEEQLAAARERLDPELLVLEGTLERALDLLAEVPAGKLAIAELAETTRADVEELERAGFDAVIVPTTSLS